MSRATVAVVMTRPSDVLEDIDKLLGQAQVQRHLDPLATTALAPTNAWHRPLPAVNTTPWQLEGAIAGLRSRGFRCLSCYQSRSPMVCTERAEEENGQVRVLKHHLIPTLYADRQGHVTWETYEPKAEMLVLHKLYPDGIPVPDYLLGKNLVLLPTMKCDAVVTAAGAMLASYFAMLPDDRHKVASKLAEVLVDLLAIQREVLAGVFTLMDGTTAGDGLGPRKVTPVQKNVMLASADPVAVDAIAARMMGFDPMSLDHIRLAHERGLGVGRTQEIEVVGADVAGENWAFKPGRDAVSALGDLAARGASSPLGRRLLRPEVIDGASRLVRAHQDNVRWRQVDKKAVKNWRMESPWGDLFDRYAIEGHMVPGRDLATSENTQSS